ncbi:MAG: mannose-1-phosphate guanylyltransferase/mannose-6-phosphate isomerase [Coriobacteriia bacterium]|jgi:mannose-1-phosphate guanylyltransferase/mannose-6-phosphate isomerase|nr:mannose-1-phosphate guanylyltransferase/mannose-6-phosphate isomerase [Coriobacteriia bacterium]
MDITTPGVYAAILAGGSGQRFWPLSRELSPKQMLSVFGQESLIVQAVKRVENLVPHERVFIVTNERLFDELRNHLTSHADRSLNNINYLQEPLPRNTAPAIAYAAATIELLDPQAVMVVLPSDHILHANAAWHDCLMSAAALAHAGYLVTIGITPTRPETAYGYVKAAEEMPEFAEGSAVPRHAARFVEKPGAERAARFLAEGGYSWNAGIFVMGAARVLEEMQLFEDTAEIARTARWLAAAQAAGTLDAGEARDRFGALPSISIDYAVMERSEHVAVIPSALSWSDVGSLEALGNIAEPDGAGNVRVGRGVDIDTHDSIIYGTDRLVATLGVEDLMVIDTADATLVARKDRAQDVRFVVDALKAAGAEEVVKPKVSLRPWGSWTSLLAGPGFQIKLLEIKPGGRSSLQRHHHRSEHWIVVAGMALVTRDGERMEVHVNESAYIPLGSHHRIENCGKVPLKVIEVQVGEYLGEDDIVRIEDDWNREA